MISHEAGFAALHMTDHVPFYTNLSPDRLHFCNTLYRVILTKNTYPCFNGSLDNLERLGFCHNNQPDLPRVAAAFARGACNSIQRGLIVFTNRGGEVRHKIIIMPQSLNSEETKQEGKKEITAARSKRRSVRCDLFRHGARTSLRCGRRYKYRKLRSDLPPLAPGKGDWLPTG